MIDDPSDSRIRALRHILRKIAKTIKRGGRSLLGDAARPDRSPRQRRQTAALPLHPATPIAVDGLLRSIPVQGAAAPPDAGTPRFSEGSFEGSEGRRAFKLFEPGGHAGRQLPLVVMLHGCTQDPDDFAAGTRMNELAQEHGVFVLYPAQAREFNANRCWNWYLPGDQHRGAGEPALLAELTLDIVATHPVDADRVYVAGLSAGGAMAAILAREYPDVFAAAGVHSGLAAGAAHGVASAFLAMKTGESTLAHRWRLDASANTLDALPPTLPPAPVIVVHGDADVTVASANGQAVIAAALAAALDGPPQNIIHAGPAQADSRERRFTRTVWQAAAAVAGAPSVAEHWVVHGSSHAWSGGAPSASYTDPLGPDASREMLRFFLEHPRAERVPAPPWPAGPAAGGLRATRLEARSG